MISNIITRLQHISRELALFAAASFSMGVATSIVDTTLNNFLNDRFSLSGFQRSFLEFPRELPGLLVVFISATLWFLCSRRLGAFAMLFAALGTLLTGFISSTYTIVVFCLFIYSVGQHVIMPLMTTIGMELSREGKTGQRLGQLNSITNLAAILGSFLVFVCFKYLNLHYQHTFALAAVGLMISSLLMFAMKPDKPQPARLYLKLHREYRLYYILAVLYGARKQIFMTFGVWVIVTVFNQPTQTIATLVTIGGIIGILTQPMLGWAIDRFGERTILIAEAILFVFVCFGFGFSRFLFVENVALIITCICYLLDRILMSVNMARSTYMKKIALVPEDIQPALTASITIDHFFSIGIALIGGVIWSRFGFQYVFLIGVFVAFCNFLTALRMRLPDTKVVAVQK